MSLSHRTFNALRPAPYLVVFGLAIALLPGCQNTYSESMSYPVRTDPILGELNKATEYVEPDRPGQLPLYTVKDADDDRNPFYAQRQALFDNPKNRDTARLDPKLKEELDWLLFDVFGTPAQPKVAYAVAGVPEQDIPRYNRKLNLSGDVLAEGSRLYRQHCLHCHGLTGDGRGPTAKWVNPHPRDYRLGLFKFTSVDQSEKTLRPRREDLYRVLQHGVEGTAMPAFNLLPEPEQEALVSYVIHLAIRGYAEYEVLSEMTYSAKDAFAVPGKWKSLERYMLYATGPAEKKGSIRKEIELWVESQDKPIVLPAAKPRKKEPTPQEIAAEETASIKRGKELFLGLAKDQDGKVVGGTTCVSCHKDYGREALFKYDEWGTLVRPSNLTKGVYRGGGRPIDLYYRIHSGINGSGMIPFGKTMTSEQIWDLVNFVRALPHPAMRQKAEIELK